MQLMDLLHDFTNIEFNYNEVVKGLQLDSRLVNKGDVFFATPGLAFDARKFIPQALKRGAMAVVKEDEAESIEWVDGKPVISMPNLSEQVGKIAARYYGYPSQQMKVVGVTGTNGKTSCCYLLAKALKKLDRQCGFIGTLGSGIVGKLQSTGFTTPDCITLQKQFATFLEQGVEVVVMEVSSHALEQHRVSGIGFDVAVFTNLSHDHLDYHGDMERYARAKKMLFTQPGLLNAVINSDDPVGREWIQNLRHKVETYSYSLDEDHRINGNSIFSKNIELKTNGVAAEVSSPWGWGELHASLLGRFNVSNLLAVVTTLCLLDVSLADALAVAQELKGVPGRMQVFQAPGTPMAIVDYAHTPDALDHALETLREHCQGKLYCVFGCGGDRDKTKRPEMAAIAEQYADHVIVTNDNPRNEEPAAIVSDIKVGFKDLSKVEIEMDRAQAIQKAMHQAREGDMILVAGKGHESTQTIKDQVLPFSDVEEVTSQLEMMKVS